MPSILFIYIFLLLKIVAKNILGHVFWCKKFSRIEQEVLWSTIAAPWWHSELSNRVKVGHKI